MPTEMVLLAKEIPDSTNAALARTLARWTVLFLQPTATGPGVLGSGVLARVGTNRVIVTADHVLKAALKIDDEIALFLQRANLEDLFIIPKDKRSFTRYPLPDGTEVSEGPDLAIIHLSPEVADAIESPTTGKSFADLDEHRGVNLGLSDGCFWYVQGFPDEGTKIQPDLLGEPGLTKYFYNFTGVGGPDKVDPGDGPFDYIDLPIEEVVDRGDVVPNELGGMSGGGIWQVPFKPEGANWAPGSPVLAGIIFCEGFDDARRGKRVAITVRGHGRRSIDEVVREVVANPSPA